jgi:hypothetical protein
LSFWRRPEPSAPLNNDIARAPTLILFSLKLFFIK